MMQYTTTTRACLPLPLGEGWGEGAKRARGLESTIANNVAEILEA
jgi:hypothetical protein